MANNDIIGDFYIGRAIYSVRSNELLENKIVSSNYNISEFDSKMLRFTYNGTMSAILPNATALPNGWCIKIIADSNTIVVVKTYHASSPELLKEIKQNQIYEFILLDNSTEKGIWKSVFFQETTILWGTIDPPSPAGLPEGTIYFKIT